MRCLAYAALGAVGNGKQRQGLSCKTALDTVLAALPSYDLPASSNRTLHCIFLDPILNQQFVPFSICPRLKFIEDACTKCDLEVHSRCSDPSNRSLMQLYKAPSSFRNVSTVRESEEGGVLSELAIGHENG